MSMMMVAYVVRGKIFSFVFSVHICGQTSILGRHRPFCIELLAAELQLLRTDITELRYSGIQIFKLLIILDHEYRRQGNTFVCLL